MIDLVAAAVSALPEGVVKEDILMLALSGSRAYGTDTIESDYDLVGVVAPPVEYILGDRKWKPIVKESPEVDVKLHTPAKYMSMLRGGAVNNLEVLFLPTLMLSPLLEPWWEQRAAFINRSTVSSILGYAQSTLKRFRDVDGAQHGSKRRALIQRDGYDGKAAAHCFRWLWMGMDLLKNPNILTVEMSPARRTLYMAVKSGQSYLAYVVEDEIHRLVEDFSNAADTLKETLGLTPKGLSTRLLIDLHRQLL